jgi:hypothetical protein
MREPITVMARDNSGTKTYPPLTTEEIAKIKRGSMVMVFDPETQRWHWVVVEKVIEEGKSFQGRVDAHCVIGPTLKHGGTIIFHADNVLRRWPTPVGPIFEKRWFRIVSSILSTGAPVKMVKRPDGSSY